MGRYLSTSVALVAISHALTCSADVHYVSKTGSNEFPYTSPWTAATSIQDGVDAAQHGDIVDVGPGEYVEQVTLRDGIILWGWGFDVTVIRQPEELPKDAPYAVRGTEDVQIRNLKVAAPRPKALDILPVPWYQSKDGSESSASRLHATAHQ